MDSSLDTDIWSRAGHARKGRLGAFKSKTKKATKASSTPPPPPPPIRETSVLSAVSTDEEPPKGDGPKSVGRSVSHDPRTRRSSSIRRGSDPSDLSAPMSGVEKIRRRARRASSINMSVVTPLVEANDPLVLLQRLKGKVDREGRALISSADVGVLMELARRDDRKEAVSFMQKQFTSEPRVFPKALQDFLLDNYTTSSETKVTTAGRSRGSGTDSTLKRAETLSHLISESTSAALKGSLSAATNEWYFDVFDLNETVPGHAMSTLGWVVLCSHGIPSHFNIPLDKLRGFLLSIEGKYRSDIPYHTQLHAADVTQSLHYIIARGGLGKWMTDVQVFGAIIAALSHDLAHPGVNNVFLTSTKSELALTYNDKSPLEHMHAATMWSTIYHEDHCNIVENCSKEEEKELRHLTIEMILATDNGYHFMYLKKLQTTLEKEKVESPASGAFAAPGMAILARPETQLLVLQVALHAADVSNPAKPWDYYMSWTRLVVEEFYNQGDRERELGLPVNPMMDRENPIPMPKFQLGFINAIVLPLYTTVASIPGVTIDPCVEELRNNANVWNRQVLVTSPTKQSSSPSSK